MPPTSEPATAAGHGYLSPQPPAVDAGYGDSVLDHFEQVVRAEERGPEDWDATGRAEANR